MSIAESISTAPQRQAVAPRPATLVKFPAVEPGQLWLIEAPLDAALARHALDGVNVVMYDRALAGALSGALPLGTYAEAAADGLADPSAARCVGLTGDGWSVVRLVAPGLPQRQRTGRVRALVDALIAAKAPGHLAVQIFAETDGICEHEETRLDRLAHLVATHPRETRLTIVVAAANRNAARLQPVAGNGLAG